MDTRTGMLIGAGEMETLEKSERKHFVQVKRDLSKVEEARMKINKYSLCGCGSGLKFKFCCFQKS